MYIRLNFIADNIPCIENSEWDIINNKNIEHVRDKIEKILASDEISVKDVEDLWFPMVKAHIFISHSHKDIEIVRDVARYLYSEYGLICFVDEAVWGHVDELLNTLDQKYCFNRKTGNYSYERRNITTAHVHMILQIALTKMINSTECFMVLNTPNSINIDKEVEKGYTYSPWIYSEIFHANVIAQKKPERIGIKEERVCFASNELKMKHEIDLKKFYSITIEDFENAAVDGSEGEDLLDSLYEIIMDN